jgi:hypothetical protein
MMEVYRLTIVYLASFILERVHSLNHVLMDRRGKSRETGGIFVIA